MRSTSCARMPLARRRMPAWTAELQAPPASYVDAFEEAVEALSGELRDGDVCFVVGAGDVTELGPMLRERLERDR